MALMAIAGKAEAMLTFAERFFYAEHVYENGGTAESMLAAARSWKPQGAPTRVDIAAADDPAETSGSKQGWQKGQPYPITVEQDLATKSQRPVTMPPAPANCVDRSTNAKQLEKKDYAQVIVPKATAEDKLQGSLISESRTLNPLSRGLDLSTLNAVTQGRRDLGHRIAPGVPLDVIPDHLKKFQKMLFEPSSKSAKPRPFSRETPRRALSQGAQLERIQEHVPLECRQVDIDFNLLAKEKKVQLRKRQKESGRMYKGTPSQTYFDAPPPPLMETFRPTTPAKMMPVRRATTPARVEDEDSDYDDTDWGSRWKDPDTDPTRKGTAFDRKILDDLEKEESTHKNYVNPRNLDGARREIRSYRGDRA